MGASGDFDNNVCPGLELDETSVVFLHDERYDLSDGSVIPEDWVVTTACRGFALAKMAMLGYRPYDNPSGGDDREATLRMIRADYCGDGTSYTGIGVPMDWVDANANVVWDPLTMSNRLEAHWTRQGAECIGVMRRPDLHPEFDPTEPDRDLPPICGLPQCSNDHFDGEIEGVWSSMVPLVP